MNRKYVISIIFAISILSINSSAYLRAQWTPTPGPYGGDVGTLAIDGSNLLAGTGTGVFISTDNGSHWKPSNLGLAFVSVNTVAIAGGNFVVCSEGGILTSTNTGTSWQNLYGPVNNESITALLQSGSNLFASSRIGKIYLSTDSGLSWTRSDSGQSATQLNALAKIGNDLFAGGFGIVRSTDQGAHWHPVDSTLNYVDVFGVRDSVLFASTAGGGVYRTSNAGHNWAKTAGAFPQSWAYSFAQIGGLIFAAMPGGLYSSANDGDSWDSSAPGMENELFWSLHASGTTLYSGMMGGGVYVSNDSAATWTAINNGLTAATFQRFAEHDGDLYVTSQNSGLHRTTDNGASWTRIALPDKAADASAIISTGTSLLVDTDFGCRRTTDGGSTWMYADIVYQSQFVREFAMTGSAILAAFSSVADGIYRSTNDGLSWVKVNSSFASPTTNCMVACNSTFVVGTNNGAYRSTNNGFSWTFSNSGMDPAPHITAMVVGGSTILAAGTGVIYRSTDEGLSWSKVDSTLYVGAMASSGTDFYVGYSNQIFVSHDSGTTWQVANQGLSGEGGGPLIAHGGYLFTGSHQVWRRPLSEMTSVEFPDRGHIPSEFSLGQNYPNPFNPATTISYQLAEMGDVTLTIYNILGEKILQLVHEMKDAGYYTTSWHASNNPSGIYYLRMIVIDQAGRESYQSVNKIVLMK